MSGPSSEGKREPHSLEARLSWLAEKSWPYGLLVVAMIFGAGLLGLGIGLQKLLEPDAPRPLALDQLLPLPPEVAPEVARPPSFEQVALAAHSVADLQDAFQTEGYDLTAWLEAAPPRPPVPPVTLDRLPGDLRDLEDATERKRLFLQSVLPLVLIANRTVRTARLMLLDLAARDEPPSPAEEAWLGTLAALYDTPEGDLPALLERLDEVPVAIALAQAAVETGWGTSRFALDGNALYGARTWREDLAGLVPEERPEGETFKVRQFAALFDSVWSYLHNLNTSPHYSDWRNARAALREAGEPLAAAALLPGLAAYSELGEDYLALLKTLIEDEDLERLQAARLSAEVTQAAQ